MQDDGLGQTALSDQAIEKLGLLHSARIAIEEKSPLAVGLSDPRREHFVDEIVTYQSPTGHDGSCGVTQRRSGLNLRAQHIAGRNRRYPQPVCDQSRLRPFAAAWRSKEQKDHATSAS